MPESERAESVKKVCFDELPIERALGVQWNVESDTFGFKICIKDKPVTRRGMLSIVHPWIRSPVYSSRKDYPAGVVSKEDWMGRSGSGGTPAGLEKLVGRPTKVGGFKYRSLLQAKRF